MAQPQMNYFLTRLLAFFQCVLGFLLIVFGIVDRVIVKLWSSQVVIPIWVGVWILAGGCIGIAASSRSRPVPLQSLVGTFMAFSIVSSVLAAVIIICYSIILGVEIPATNPCRRIYYSYHPYSSEYCPSSRTKNIAISVMVLLFGIAEFPIAIWSAVLQCKACACCYGSSGDTTQGGQVVYMTNLSGGQNGQHVVVQPVTIAGQQCSQPASIGQAPVYFPAQGASPATSTSQPVVMVQGPMVPLNQPTGQPVFQGQSFVAVNQPHGQPVVQGQPIMAFSQPSGQPVVLGQPIMAIGQQTGQLVVQGQPVVAVSQASGQPLVQGQSLPAVNQQSGQPMVQGQYMVAVSQPSGQPMVVATQPFGQSVVQGQQLLLVNEPQGQSVSQEQSVTSVNQPSGQPALQEQQVLIDQSPGQSEASQQYSEPISDSQTENV